MSYPICEHVKTSGKRCGSPALSGETFCYYHKRLEEALPAARNMYFAYNRMATRGEDAMIGFHTPELEDAAGIQIGYMQTLYGIANGHLDCRRAKLMLSALHGAAPNLQRLESCLGQTLSKVIPRKPPAGVKSPGGRVDKARPTRRVQKLPRPSQTKAGTGRPRPSVAAAVESVIASA